MSSWTFQHVMRMRYDAAKDKKRRGWVNIFEGKGGFGVRCFESGRRSWIVVGSRPNPQRPGKWRSFDKTLGEVGVLDLKEARAAANEAREAVQGSEDTDAAEKLRATTLRQAIDFYVKERLCAESSKRDLASCLKTNAGKLLDHPLLSITSTQLKAAYDGTLERVAMAEKERVAKLAKMTAAERLLAAPSGHFTGIKAGHNLVECFGRVQKFWIMRHAAELQALDVKVPPPVSLAIRQDLKPQRQPVKLPPAELAKLLKSLKSYPGNPLHPLLVRLLLASGQRVGVTLGLRWEWVQKDRIVIPADAPLSKVRYNKRHLEHMQKVIPITAEVASVLKALRKLSPLYGDLGKMWLFPSPTAKKNGHLTEEKMIVRALRKHSGVRFACHQLRHVVATVAAEELGLSRAEVGELLDHAKQDDVTARYIDSRLKRHHQMLSAISKELSK